MASKLTPGDFGFWGLLAEQDLPTSGIFSPSLDVLQRRIKQEMNSIPFEMLRCTMTNFLQRINQCREVNGDLQYLSKNWKSFLTNEFYTT